MKIKLFKKIMSTIIVIGLVLIGVTGVVNLPKDTQFEVNIKALEFESNISWGYLGQLILEHIKVLITGSLGETTDKIPAWTYIKEGFPKSMSLLLGGVAISLVFGIPKGVFDSKKEKARGSNMKLLTTLTLLSMPDIFVILVLQAFVVWLYQHDIKILPVAGHGTFKHAILPMVSLSIIPANYIARITAISMDRVFEQEYIRTAMGKGASRLRIIWIHVLRNAIVEIIDSFGSLVTILLSSLLVVEYLFYYPGLTLIMYNQYLDGEPNVVVGVAIVLGIFYFIMNLIFKVLNEVLTPKSHGEA